METDVIEQLTEATSLLARRNAALEDFAVLAAHELKTPLNAALVADDPRQSVREALALVESLLDAARAAGDPSAPASPAAVLDEVLRDLDPKGLHVVSELPDSFPLPGPALRVLLRNLVRNAVAAGARSIRVYAAQCAGRWTLAVDDDGVGLESDGYSSGSGVGLGLTRRLAGQYGGEVELAPRAAGGTRALVALGAAA
ncbi:MAG TPA: HAMP domain-containing sensor histidine kinase [Gaiellaceae bacterium]|nr:HAMP domain-containing sensor histidine kinase [Gaiellaceae bacterium]